MKKLRHCHPMSKTQVLTGLHTK